MHTCAMLYRHNTHPRCCLTNATCPLGTKSKDFSMSGGRLRRWLLLFPAPTRARRCATPATLAKRLLLSVSALQPNTNTSWCLWFPCQMRWRGHRVQHADMPTPFRPSTAAAAAVLTHRRTTRCRKRYCSPRAVFLAAVDLPSCGLRRKG